MSADECFPLVFEGGTSLLLRIPNHRRLSIDIDIACTLDDKELERILAMAGQMPPFFRHEEDDRGPERLQLNRHFLSNATDIFCRLNEACSPACCRRGSVAGERGDDAQRRARVGQRR